jgi:hypothetical protein
MFVWPACRSRWRSRKARDADLNDFLLEDIAEGAVKDPTEAMNVTRQ